MSHALYFVILAISTIIIVILAVKTNMLRTVVFNTANFNTIATANNQTQPKPSFSLGRSQLAFWSIIIVSSYIYLLLCSSTSPVIAIPNVTLILLGIAAATTVVAKSIDNSQQANNNPGTVSGQDIPSKGFLIDIISDENGVSIHRLQNVVWTLIIGYVYIDYVCAKTLLPDETVITTTLLGLMGISAGAYLGVKTTENTTPVPQPAQSDTPASQVIAVPAQPQIIPPAPTIQPVVPVQPVVQPLTVPAQPSPDPTTPPQPYADGK